MVMKMTSGLQVNITRSIIMSNQPLSNGLLYGLVWLGLVLKPQTNQTTPLGCSTSSLGVDQRAQTKLGS